MQESNRSSLRNLLAGAGEPSGRFIADEVTRIDLHDLCQGRFLGADQDELRDRNVLVAVRSQLACAAALIGLDGLARRILLCPPDLAPRHIPPILSAGEVDCIVCDTVRPEYGNRRIIRPSSTGTGSTAAAALTPAEARRPPTEWVLFTSGTTGAPKLAVHSLESLSGHLPVIPVSGSSQVWCTFYDIRRYGGLQVLLRALVGGGSLVLSCPEEAPGAFLTRAGACGVTHILGTPSHWRRALMTHQTGCISPDYVRLSGEVSDQTILDRLRATYSKAIVAHAFASTEAGVAFEVTDGLAGFPADFVGRTGASADLRVIDGSLCVRSARVAARYLGGDRGSLVEASGFVDTGDMVERKGDRYHFAGRREGIINIGGQKVHPEEVEAVINQHPGVEMSLVKGRRNPITGAVVVADVVARPLTQSFAVEPHEAAPRDAPPHLVDEILERCREELAPHKVPAMVRIVPSLEIATSGKLVRLHA